MAWKTPEDCKYLKSDEWVRLEGDTATFGITDYAQDQLNDIVFVELPSVGAALAQRESFGAVESVKAASELSAPISGTITEVNSALEKTPELVNGDPYGAGWIVKVKVKDAAELDDLLDAAAYIEWCNTR